MPTTLTKQAEALHVAAALVSLNDLTDMYVTCMPSGNVTCIVKDLTAVERLAVLMDACIEQRTYHGDLHHLSEGIYCGVTIRVVWIEQDAAPLFVAVDS